MTEPDHVGRILEQWRVERPDLDTSPMGVIGRLHRLADRLDAELRPVFAEAGLSDGDFDVLASLRRAGAPYELTPGELGASTMVTSGAVTKRVDRLVAAGYVERRVCDDDARSRRVRLTDEGLRARRRPRRPARRQRAPAARRSQRPGALAARAPARRVTVGARHVSTSRGRTRWPSR